MPSAKRWNWLPIMCQRDWHLYTHCDFATTSQRLTQNSRELIETLTGFGNDASAGGVVNASRSVGRVRGLDQAIELLRQLLDQAPPGFVAWSLLIDPLLRRLRASGFDRVRGRLIARANTKVSRLAIMLESSLR